MISQIAKHLMFLVVTCGNCFGQVLEINAPKGSRSDRISSTVQHDPDAGSTVYTFSSEGGNECVIYHNNDGRSLLIDWRSNAMSEGLGVRAVTRGIVNVSIKMRGRTYFDLDGDGMIEARNGHGGRTPNQILREGRFVEVFNGKRGYEVYFPRIQKAYFDAALERGKSYLGANPDGKSFEAIGPLPGPIEPEFARDGWKKEELTGKLIREVFGRKVRDESRRMNKYRFVTLTNQEVIIEQSDDKTYLSLALPASALQFERVGSENQSRVCFRMGTFVYYDFDYDGNVDAFYDANLEAMSIIIEDALVPAEFAPEKLDRTVPRVKVMDGHRLFHDGKWIVDK